MTMLLTGEAARIVPVARGTEAARRPMLDAARVVAGLGVIWFHSLESETLRASGVLGRFSVAFYTLAAILFMVEGLRRRPERTWSEYVGGRFRRLYLPFLGWSALAAMVLVVLHHVVDESTLPAQLTLGTLVTGTLEPLWFIPFALIGGALLFPVAKWMVRARWREWVVAAAFAALALTLDRSNWYDVPLQGVPLVGKLFEVTWHRWSALYWGLAFAVVYAHLMKAKGKQIVALEGIAAIAGAALLTWCLWRQWTHGLQANLKVAAGLGFGLTALGPWKGKAITWLARLAPLSFGVYVSHYLWITVARAFANHAGVPVCWQRDVVVFLVATALSLLGVRTLACWPWMDWLTGREYAGAVRAGGRVATA